MAAKDPQKNQAASAWGVGVGLAVVVGLVFALSIRGEFLPWDDDINITANPHLRDLSWEGVKWMFTDVSYMRRYVPFAWLGWAIEQRLFGLTAISAHVGNVLFHALSTVFVFLLVRRLLPRRDNEVPASARNVAAAAALLWALHPLRVEVVAWASGRMYAQGGCFALLGVLAYVRAAESPRRVWWLALSLAALAIAILTYPVFVPVVALLPLLDAYVLRRFESGAPLWRGAVNRAVWIEKLRFLALAGAIGLVTIAARAKAQGLWAPPPTLTEFPLFDRVAQAGYVWSYYVWRPFWPFGLAPVYTTLVDFDPRSAVFVGSMAAIVGATIFLFWRRRHWPGAWALWLAHLILIAPMLGLAEHPHYANDRYAYLQGVLGAIGIGWLMRSFGRVGIFAAGFAAAALCGLTASQVTIWRDGETLFRRLYEHVGPTDYRADIAMRLGDTLRGQRRFAEAKGFFEESLRIAPNVPRAAVPHTGLARMAMEEGRAQVALGHFQEAVRLDPRFEPAWLGLGELLLGAGQWAEGVAVLERAVALNESDASARELLGAALVQVRRPAEAVAQLEVALRLRPGALGTACNLVVALADAGRRDEAVTLGKRLVVQAARSAQAHFALGHAQRAAGDIPNAIAAYAKATELQPDHAAAREALAALRAP